MASVVNFTDFSSSSVFYKSNGKSEYLGGTPSSGPIMTGPWTFNMNQGQEILGAWTGSAVTSTSHSALYIDNPDNTGTTATTNKVTWTMNIDGGVASFNGTGVYINNFLSAGPNTLNVKADGLISGTHSGVYIDAATNISNAGNITGQHAVNIQAFYDGETNGGVAGDTTPDYQYGTTTPISRPADWVPDSNITAATKITITNLAGGQIIGVNAQNNPEGSESVIGVNSFSYATVTITNSGLIFGGAYHYVDVNNDHANDIGYDGDAINVHGTLLLTNNAGGEIDGNIEAGGFGSTVTNAANAVINGTIHGHVADTVLLDVPSDPNDPGSAENLVEVSAIDGTGTIYDANHDGIFNLTAGDVLISKLAADVFKNSGTINGTFDYGYDNMGTTGAGDDGYMQVAFDLNIEVDQVSNLAGGIINGDVWTGGGNDTLTNNGLIYGHVSMGDGNDTVTNTGSILTNDNKQTTGPSAGNDDYYSSGVNLGDGTNTLTNSGSIEGGVGAGVGFDTITNNAGAFIYNGIHVGSGGSKIVNNGYVDGGISSSDGETDVDNVTNSATGLIYNGVYVGGGNNVVTNAGRIFDGITTDAGNNTITNSGSLYGDINAGYGATGGPGGHNTITNNKLIEGNISTGDAGAATVSGKTVTQEVITNNGTVDGFICVGTGDRLIVNKGVVHSYIMTGMTSSATVTGTDTITNSGDVWKVEFATDKNMLNNSGLIRDGVFMNMNTSGNDTETVSNLAAGNITNGIAFGGGTNKLDNAGQIEGKIDAGNGGNTFTNEATGYIAGNIAVGNGTNSLTNLGGIGGNYLGGTGVDTVINSKDIGNIFTGTGTDSVTNNKGGHIHGLVVLDAYMLDSNGYFTGEDPTGDAANTFSNAGLVDGNVFGGDGGNTITNYIGTAAGTIMGKIQTGGGNDVIDNTKNGVIMGGVYMGGGTNAFKGGTGAEQVHYQGGVDTDTMGAGNDTVYFDHAQSSGFSLDGGTAGNDMLDFRGLDGSTGINLNMATNSLSIGAVTGTVTNFETVWGSAYSDTIVGTNGNDVIHGGKGSDVITGGSGGDQLWGDAGHSDDTFKFTALTDSTATHLTGTNVTRDVIYGFAEHSAGGTDHIEFTGAITSALVGSVTLATANADFTNTGHAQVHTIQAGNQTIVELDVTGDGKADMSIALDGTHYLALSDFVVI